MQSDHIRELMQENFGAVWSDEHNWTNVHDGQRTKTELLAAFIALHISDDEVLIRIEDTHATRIPTSEAADYIAPHVLAGDIEIADPSFTEFVFVSIQGVAAGWSKCRR